MTTERPDRGARALATVLERIHSFVGPAGCKREADAILANGAVFLPGPVEGAGKTRFWMDEDGTHWRSPEECGAPAVGGPCTLPRGHNVGRVDVPDNHARAHLMADSERDLETALAESMRDAGISPYHRGTTAEGLASGAIISALAARGWRLVPSVEEPGELPSPEFTSADRPYPASPWAAQPSAEPDWRQLYEDQLARYARRFNAEAAQPSAEPGLHPDDADAKRRPIQTVGGVRVGAAALTPDRPTPEPVGETE